MEIIDKRDLIEVIYQNTEDLRQKIDTHCLLMAALLEHVPDSAFHSASGHNPDTKKADTPPSNFCFFSSGFFGGNQLKQVIKEAIEVLEETKKSFKSKRLEILRKKLTQALIESK